MSKLTKKVLSFILAITLISLMLPTAALAVDPSDPLDFSKLLGDHTDVYIQTGLKKTRGIVKNGFFCAANNGSSLKGILSASTSNDISLFFFDHPTAEKIYLFPVVQKSEKDKQMALVSGWDNTWYYDAIGPKWVNDTPVKRESDDKIVGYTDGVFLHYLTKKNISQMMLYVSDNNTVYPAITSIAIPGSNYEPVWEDFWPKDDETLTTILRETFATTEDYTIAPILEQKNKSNKNLLYYSIIATASEGGSIIEQGEKLFRPGDIDQTYTVNADEGYTIYYIQVDRKTVPNSIDFGDTATFNFDCIYGPRSIKAVFKKK